MNSDARISKLEQDLEEIEKLKIPNGRKPFKLGSECPSWDEPSNLAGTKIELQIPEK